MPDDPRELVADAPAADPAWLACLAPVTAHTLLAFAYEGLLAPGPSGSMAAPTQQSVLKLLGIAGARMAVLTRGDAATLHASFAALSPLLPAFLVGVQDATSEHAEALAALVREGSFDHVLYVGTDELALGHRYAVPSTTIRVGRGSASGTRATYWISEQDAANALCSRLFHVLIELAPAESVTRP